MKWRSERFIDAIVRYRGASKKLKLEDPPEFIPSTDIQENRLERIPCSALKVTDKIFASYDYQVWNESTWWHANLQQKERLTLVYDYINKITNELGDAIRGTAILFVAPTMNVLYMYRTKYNRSGIYIETNPNGKLPRGYRLTQIVHSTASSSSSGSSTLGATLGSASMASIPAFPFIIDYKFSPLSVDSIADEIDKADLGEDEVDPIMITELKDADEPVMQMRCCGKKVLKSTLEGIMGAGHTMCPLCNEAFVGSTGPQPSGKMHAKIQPFHCAGHVGTGTIEILYDFPDGTRNGKSYAGDRRRNYVPNNSMGREILQILIHCFREGLLFKLGTSATTGADNVITFNIHQKTRTDGGEVKHGWPDPTYIDRLKSECAASATDKAGCGLT